MQFHDDKKICRTRVLQSAKYIMLGTLLVISHTSFAAPPTQRVLIQDIEATLVPNAQPALRVRAKAQTTLPIPITHLFLGVVYARNAKDLQHGNLGQLYDTPPPYATRHHGATIIRQTITLLENTSQQLEAIVPIDPHATNAQAFGVHLLGYTLGEGVYDGLLLSLLRTGNPADEFAAVQAMGLFSTPQFPADPFAVRQRFANKSHMVPLLADTLLAALSAPQPDHATTATIIFAIRSLGMLGGAIAKDTLEQTANHPNLRVYNDALQIFAIARQQHGPWQSPLAHALPAPTRTLRDVIRAAQFDLENIHAPPPSASEKNAQTSPSNTAVETTRPSSSDLGTTIVIWSTAVLAVALIGAAIIGLRMGRRK